MSFAIPPHASLQHFPRAQTHTHLLPAQLMESSGREVCGPQLRRGGVPLAGPQGRLQDTGAVGGYAG
eukprot:7170605-Alexandrium_andersonii.AAC.1